VSLTTVTVYLPVYHLSIAVKTQRCREHWNLENELFLQVLAYFCRYKPATVKTAAATAIINRETSL